MSIFLFLAVFRLDENNTRVGIFTKHSIRGYTCAIY